MDHAHGDEGLCEERQGGELVGGIETQGGSST